MSSTEETIDSTLKLFVKLIDMQELYAIVKGLAITLDSIALDLHIREEIQDIQVGETIGVN